MTKRMLVDATHPEETRVAIVESYRDNNRLEDFDFGLASKPILRGNIYLAKVMRIEPSLQAAFVEYGGNRHGFLPFSEIHPDYFRIPMADRQETDDMEGEESEVDAEGDLQDTDEQDQASGESTETVDLESEQDLPAAEQANEPTQVETQSQAESNEAPPALAAFAHPISDEDTSVGLITDFGNAVVNTGSLTEVAMPEAPPESVGGEVTERIVRQHRPRYKIQEVLKRGQVMLIQVVKEERGNKGAALTTFLSLAGRYCVLMPNTDHGGGVSRKITNHQDRRRMKEILDQLEIPEGMAVILRTAGMEQDPPEIQRDLEYLLSMWDNIREQTLQSSAPALIYEEANLIKRSVRDLYTHDINEILVAGQEGYEKSRDFMRAIMPDEIEKIKPYTDPIPLFIRYQVENQIDTLHNPIVQLRSGGYLVINPTEALVSIDVNSGRATRERHIEETAFKTNLEAAEEIARQLRLRDLAGLVVIDFIDMEDGRNNAAVERRLKEAMKSDRARLQIGRISPFGLLELSRQRLRPSLVEINFEKCPHCSGTGYIRSPDSAALSVLRAIEEEAIRQRSSVITAHVHTAVAIFMLNHKRVVLDTLEKRYGVSITVVNDDTIPPPGYKIERVKGRPSTRPSGPAVDADQVIADTERDLSAQEALEPDTTTSPYEGESQNESSNDEGDEGQGSGRRRSRSRFRQNDRGNRRGRNRDRHHERRNNDEPQPSHQAQPAAIEAAPAEDGNGFVESFSEGEGQHQGANNNGDDNPRRRRRGRRGGRRRNGEQREGGANWQPPAHEHETAGAVASYAQPREPVHIPMSIHELDTTPKPVSQETKSGPQHPKADHQVSRSYEVVNPPTDQPKGGWWRRLTGQ